MLYITTEGRSVKLANSLLQIKTFNVNGCSPNGERVKDMLQATFNCLVEEQFLAKW